MNEKKLGGTLSELIDRVHAQGVKFGIWIEPEMVNEDSNLYREHPDWAIQIPGKLPVRSRNQLILDFSRKEVRDNIFNQICAVFDQGKIDYVKWDMNRSMADVYAGNLAYDYVLGVYDFMERLVTRYPDILLEGCSGGGGRFDAGMLYYSPQIWCSDNTDAMNRLDIQYGTSFFYPISTYTKSFHYFVMQNYNTVKNVEEFAHLGGYTTTTFRRLFKNLYGIPVYEWILEKKREGILEDLQRTNMRITEICNRYGFDSLSHFAHFCKDSFGDTPRALRKKAANGEKIGKVAD